MNKCINVGHPEFKKLVEQSKMNPLVLKSKVGVWQEKNDTDEFPTLEEILNPNEVNYQLKIVNALINLTIPKSDTRYAMEQKPEVLTLRLNSKQQPYIEINIRKRLRGKGVNDTQIDFIFDYMKSNNIQEISTEELALELASKYGYSVEVNTAKTAKGTIGAYYEYSGKYYNGDGIEVSKEEAMPNRPTGYYSNLTVPGGTNYTENEISTPLIIPSIKGHAQFSTDNGIGWFRSDELTSADVNDRIERGEPMNVFEELAKSANELKTRRILEIQSDLFQKGRNKESLVGEGYVNDEFPTIELYLKETERLLRLEGRGLSENEIQIELNNVKNSFKHNTTENQFLQLLNKDSNWVTFSVKSIIQDSAKKGYEKVLFPKGETAAKIEGHETIADELVKIDKEISEYERKVSNDPEYIKYLEFELKNLENELDKHYEQENYADNLTEYGDVIESQINELKDVIRKAKTQRLTKQQNEHLEKLKKRKSELKSQGIEKLKPIEAFYEIKVGNILEKQFGKDNVKTITDEFGNQWREITIDKKRDLSPILLQKSETKKKVSINRLAEQLSKRFNVEAEIISQEKAKELNPKYNGEPAFFDVSQSKAYLVDGIADKTSTVHEIFTHPFLIKIEKDNPELYNSLLKEAKSDQDIVSFVEENYAGYSDKIKDHEIIARAIDLQVQGKLDSEKHKNLIEVIMDFFSQLASTLKEIFNTEKEITSLSTLEDVVTLVLEGKSFINLNTLGIKTGVEELLNDNQTANIKEGVQKLFESNPELANAVYSKILTNSGISAENLLSLLEKENIVEKDCSGGKLKAEDGIRGKFTKGSQWEIVKDLKGYPSHSQGGVDVKIGKNGFSFTRDNGVIEAKYGLVLPKIK